MSSGAYYLAASAPPTLKQVGFISFGYPAIFIQRCNFIKAIYDRLEDKSKVHVNKAVIKYEEFENGVRVFTDDGDTYDGTFLVGADGINSTVRGLMKENAEAQNAGSGRALMTTNGGMYIKHIHQERTRQEANKAIQEKMAS